jgi:hypothetical protein
MHDAVANSIHITINRFAVQQADYLVQGRAMVPQAEFPLDLCISIRILDVEEAGSEAYASRAS